MKPLLLLAEDDDDLRCMLAAALRSHGYEVMEACDEEEARAVLEHGLVVDVLVTDVEMPGKRDGLALAERAHELDARMPIIVMSGRTLSELELPPDADFLAKPFGIGGLLRHVEAALRTRYDSMSWT
jgi:DNA-binding response OmpR family regulator